MPRNLQHPSKLLTPEESESIFWSKVRKTPSCWLWTGKKSHGYGRFFASEVGKEVQAHRWSYQISIGPIPDGLTIDHLCRTHACVNPSHLEPVTRAENVLRGNSVPAINARKTTCNQGHEFSPSLAPNGHRFCAVCMRDNRRKRYAIHHDQINSRRRTAWKESHS